jgi:hypothetical protein
MTRPTRTMKRTSRAGPRSAQLRGPDRPNFVIRVPGRPMSNNQVLYRPNVQSDWDVFISRSAQIWRYHVQADNASLKE